MLRFTLLARQSDALLLSADTDTGSSSTLEHNKITAKNLLRKLASSSGANTASSAATYGGGGGAQGNAMNSSGGSHQALTIDASNWSYHILIESGVMFLTMTETTDPSSIAFAYLEDVSREFLSQYGASIATVTRPYNFIKFDLYLQKTKKIFCNPSASRNAAAINNRGGNKLVPVRRTFKDFMGYGDRGGPGSGGEGGVKNNAAGLGSVMQMFNNQVLGFVVILVVIFIVVMIFVLFAMM